MIQVRKAACCDYTDLECGVRLFTVKVESFDEAVKLGESLLRTPEEDAACEYGKDPWDDEKPPTYLYTGKSYEKIESITVYEVTRTASVDIARVHAEEEAAVALRMKEEQVRRVERDKEARRALYESMREEFGNA